ncbi:MAG TPA: class I SAM-dependent methyltransferase [Saprospiraceae bacterium]|nr:class I SAM-dependent methyltransferase [Saprospiraceae bacterium]
MEHIQECPICGSKHFENIFTCKDHSISQQNFGLIRCRSCQFIMTSPRPAEAELGQYYASDQYISHSDTNKGLINKLYRQIRKITLRNKIRILKQHSSHLDLLDIGSGAGYFLNHARSSGYQVSGIEPDPDTRKRSIDLFNLEVWNEDQLDLWPDAQFGMITLWHVLEHVSDLNRRLEQIHRLLKNDGLLVIAVPNCSSFDATHYQDYWAGYDVPRHLWHFTPETIGKLLEKHHFACTETLPMIFDSFYVSMLSEKYKGSPWALVSGFINGLMSNINAIISNKKRYSSQIYLFRKQKS